MIFQNVLLIQIQRGGFLDWWVGNSSLILAFSSLSGEAVTP